MKFLWGMLTGAFLGAMFTMWYVSRSMNKAEQSTVTETLDDIETLPADFKPFIDRFSNDSLFQMQHISFPLAGLPAYADSVAIAERSFKYLAEEWVLHKPLNTTTTDFESTYKVAGDALVIESIIDRKNGFGMQRRFAKLSDEWHLIYYAGINKVQ